MAKRTQAKKAKAKSRPVVERKPLPAVSADGQSLIDVAAKRTAAQVAIFGAGIAGLTAAHELVERGFSVEVYEAAPPSVVERLAGARSAVGGMARTQWGRIQDDPPGIEHGFVAAEPLRYSVSDLVIPFARGSAHLDADVLKVLDDDVLPALIDARARRVEVQGFSEERDGPQPIQDRCTCCSQAGTAPARGVPCDGTYKGQRLDYRRAKAVAEYICQQLQGKLDCRISALGGGLGLADDWASPDAKRNYATCQIAENWLPGEHGFRFFPSFYRHVFDTMRRTPIPDEDTLVYVETARTVLDNVSPTTFFGLATKRSKKMTQFHRQPTGSVQELFDQLVDTLKSLGHKMSDIAHFNLKLFKYMSSSSERRAREYENVTWAEFLDSEQFSPEFREYLDSTAETLVAMQATRSDARTYGNVSVQMVMDQVLSGPRTDGTLNGPTSLAWFDHWRRYLEAQGVRFVHGRLEDFEFVDDGNDAHSTWADVTLNPGGDEMHLRLQRDYYVLALPPNVLQELARKNPRLDGHDFNLVRAFNLGDPGRAATGGALEHMVGIQYFLETDFPFLRGHIIFPDSEWRLSAVSQPQFWYQHRGWWSGYRGIVSVDISNLHSENDPAWPHTPREIALGVWEQIVRGIEHTVRHQRRHGAPLRRVDEPVTREHIPRPLYFKLDEGLEFGAHGVTRNRTPYLLNLSGQFHQRPGTPGAYEVHKQIVLAGVLMQTFTRLTTMEAANESGRHAVNAILNAAQFRGHRCEIWDPEKYEFPDLDLLVDLDARLVGLGLPHFIDILDLRELPSTLMKPDPDLAALGLQVPAHP